MEAPFSSVEDALVFLHDYHPKALMALRSEFPGLHAAKLGGGTRDIENLPQAIPTQIAIAVQVSSLSAAADVCEAVLGTLRRRIETRRYLDLGVNVLTLCSSGGTIGTLLASSKVAYSIIFAGITVAIALIGLIAQFLMRGKDLSAEESKFTSAAGFLFDARRTIELLKRLPPDDPAIPGLITSANAMSGEMIAFAASYNVMPLSKA